MQMKIEETCLQCGEILFTKIRRDITGHTTLNGASDIELETKGFTPFVGCPYCRAKNVVTNLRNRFGVNEMSVTHLLDDE